MTSFHQCDWWREKIHDKVVSTQTAFIPEAPVPLSLLHTRFRSIKGVLTRDSYSYCFLLNFYFFLYIEFAYFIFRLWCEICLSSLVKGRLLKRKRDSWLSSTQPQARETINLGREWQFPCLFHFLKCLILLEMP